MKLEKLKPGMVVYDVHSHRFGNTMLRTVGVWEVRIVSVDAAARVVTASWNGNPPQIYRRWACWRAKKPVLITTMMGGHRLATRAELKRLKKLKDPSA